MTMDTQVRTAAPAQQQERPSLVIRRVDAIPVALPLEKPVKMAGVTIAHAHNVLVRIAADGAVGWGEAASAPTMTGDTLGGLVTAVRDHLAPLLIGEDAWMRPALGAKLRRALSPMWLLGNATPEQDVAEAQAKRTQGFGFFKLKIGTKAVEAEIASTL